MSRRRRHGVNIPTRQPLRQRVRRKHASSLRPLPLRLLPSYCALLSLKPRGISSSLAPASPRPSLELRAPMTALVCYKRSFPLPLVPHPLEVSRSREILSAGWENLHILTSGFFFPFHSQFLQFGVFLFFLPLFLFSVFPSFRYVKGLQPNEISPFRGLTIPPPPS